MSVHQLRLVATIDDHDEALRFYRDVLGLKGLGAFSSEEDGRVTILEAGRATFELTDPLTLFQEPADGGSERVVA